MCEVPNSMNRVEDPEPLPDKSGRNELRVSKKLELSSCYKCNGETDIHISGKVRGSQSWYAVDCKNCGVLLDNLPSYGMGAKQGAIREYNKYAREISC